MENWLYNMGFTSQLFQILWVCFAFVMLVFSCYFIGLLCEKKYLIYLCNNGVWKHFSRGITGLVIELVVFQLLCVPMVIGNVKFSFLSGLYINLIGIISVISFLMYGKKIFVDVRKELHYCTKKMLSIDKQEKWFISISLILIGIQVFVSVFYMQVSEDSIFDYAISAQTLDHNSMFRTNAYTGYVCGLEQYVNRFNHSWYIYRPFLALVYQIHPTILGKIILVPIIFIVSYICYYFAARELIRDRKQQVLFMFFLCLINIFGELRMTSMNMLLIQADNGKSVFANIILPLLFCMFIRLYDNYKDNKTIIFIVLLNICAVAMSPTALLYSAFTVLLALGIIAFRYKNIKVWLKGFGTVLPNIVFFSLYIIQKGWGIWE